MTEVSEAVLTYDWNGSTHPMSGAHLSDMEVAVRVRMLMRDQLNHEAVCTMARDRIMALSKEVDRLTAALAARQKVTLSGAAKVILAAIERNDEALGPAWDAAQEEHHDGDAGNSSDCAEAFVRILSALEDGQ